MRANHRGPDMDVFSLWIRTLLMGFPWFSIHVLGQQMILAGFLLAELMSTLPGITIMEVGNKMPWKMLYMFLYKQEVNSTSRDYFGSVEGSGVFPLLQSNNQLNQ